MCSILNHQCPPVTVSAEVHGSRYMSLFYLHFEHTGIHMSLFYHPAL